MIIIFVPSIMKYTWQCIFAFASFSKKYQTIEEIVISLF